MDTIVGQTISHYRILEKIGTGGMGVVYKAEDTRLGRHIALKFLPVELARNADSLHRFQHEARTASALNHPNICAIYDIDSHGGKPFIVMELLEGQTLKELINGRPLPIQKILDLSVQILDALEVAHAKSIVHRDIKPANIFVTPRGQVKLLDFGVAKLTPHQQSNLEGATMEQLTVPGTVVGTLAYMAPEQLRAESVDARADLFSFGAVLYEMATGLIAFSGQTLGTTVDAVLNRSPKAPVEINSEVSPKLEEIIDRAIEKDVTLRYQSASDLRSELMRLRRGIETGKYSAVHTIGALPAARPKAQRWPLWVAATMGVIALVALSSAILNRPVDEKGFSLQNATFLQLTGVSGMELFPNLSADAKTVVYAGQGAEHWDIYTQRVGGRNAINLTQDARTDNIQPALSPNGESIAFRSEREGGGIFVMGATGESARRLTDFGFNPTWSPDGKQIAFTTESILDSPNDRNPGDSALWVVDVTTGKSRKIGDHDAVQPAWSPRGRRIAYWAKDGGQRHVFTMLPDGTQPVAVTKDASLSWNPVWSPDGNYLYFSSDRGGNLNLWRVRINETTGQPLAAPEAVTTGGGNAHREHPSVSADGRQIAYVEQNVTDNVHRIAFDPKTETVSGIPAPLSRSLRPGRDPNASPDGQWVTYASWGQQEDIFVIRTDGTGERQLTNDAYKDRVPRWSPDGSWIAFYSNRSGNYQAWLVRPDGSGLTQVTHEPENHQLTRAIWAPDGNRLAIFCAEEGARIIEVGKPGNEKKLPRLGNPDEHFNPWSWSPDGKWIAGSRRPGMTTSVGVAIYSVETGQFEILSDSGWLPVWLNDNRRLVYEDNGRLFIADRVTRRTRKLYEMPPHTIYGVGEPSPDNRFLYFSLLQREADIWLLSANN